MSARFHSVSPSSGDESADDEVTLLDNSSRKSNSGRQKIQTYLPVRKRTLCFDISVLMAVLTVFIIVMVICAKFVFPQLGIFSQLVYPNNRLHMTEPDRGEWSLNLKHTGSESCVRLLDINGDGADDVILGMAQMSDANRTIKQAGYCERYKDGCVGAVYAYDGKSGKQIYEIPTLMEVFALNCNIDINKDGLMDCIGTGRRGTFMAFDVRTGKMLWDAQTGKENFVERAWNFYTALVIPDQNSDGVDEVILPHGGDPDFEPNETDRYPGRLILMDGARGKIIGDWVDMPDKRETYNSPVLHENSLGTRYILIGTGGETVNGSLLVIRLSDFVKRVHKQQMTEGPQTLHGLHSVGGGFYKLISGRTKGIMVPVVLVDITQDGVNDIFVTSFDGQFALYDGETFKLLWKKEIDGECYTTPAVGYFNPDNNLDLMLHVNVGNWPFYNRSSVIVFSGNDGKILWTFNTTRESYSSDLVMQTDRKHQDIFVFRVQGHGGSRVEDDIGAIHGIDPQRKIGPQRDSVREKKSLSCSHTDRRTLAAIIFAVDWKSRDSPREVYRRDVDLTYYDPTQTMEEAQDITLTTTVDKTNQKHHKCAIMEQSSRTTGAIGDLNNDGKLDLAITFNAEGNLNYMYDDSSKLVTTIDVVRIDLEKHFGDYRMDRTNATEKPDFTFLPKSYQPWTSYMGTDEKSVFAKKEG